MEEITAESKRRALKGALALAAEARRFAHRNHATTFADFVRLRELSRRYVAEAWGDDSPEVERLNALLKNAFEPLYQSSGSVWKKPDVVWLDRPEVITFFTPMAARGVVHRLLAAARKLRASAPSVEVPAVVPEIKKETPEEVIRRIMGEWDVTFAVLAVRLDVSEKTLYRLCAGKDVKAGTREIIAKAVGCVSADLRWKPKKARRKPRRKKSAN